MTSESLGQGWFAVSAIADGVWAIGEPYQQHEVSSFLIEGADRAVLIDTGTGAGDIRRLAESLTSRPISVINSHSHWDHIGGNWRFDDIAIHALEADWLTKGVANDRLRDEFLPPAVTAPVPDGFNPHTFSIPPSTATTLFSGGEIVDLGGRSLKIVHAPGHSEGGIVLLDEANGILFATDVAYPAPLYAFGSDANWGDYRATMRMLAELAPSLRLVFGSHNGPEMPPEMLVAMDRAFVEIDGGRMPDQDNGELATYRFAGFAVLRPSTLNAERGDA